MSIADSVAPHLPYLRRFARSLTGSQDVGDSYVLAVLETLIADPKAFDTSLPPRIALYKIFVKVWDSLAIKQRAGDDPQSLQALAPDRRLEAITPAPRQAFLLVSVEGFSTEEAATILDSSASHMQSLLHQAGAEIALQLSADVLIIEDEPLIALDLEALVEDIGHRVQGIARTHREAMAAVEKKRPTLVLADIQLADGSSGLEAVNEMLNSFQVPVIFITAFPERLLTGEKPEPVFLVSKPFEPAMVKALISQALFFDTRSGKIDEQAA